MYSYRNLPIPNLLSFISQRKTYSSSAYSSSTVPQLEKKVSIESKYIIYHGTLQIAPIKPDLDRANPRLGVSSIEFVVFGPICFNNQ